MIGFFRRTASGIGGKLIIGLLVVSFAVYGVVEYFNRSTAGGPVATIAGADVPQEEFVLDINLRVAMLNLEPTGRPINAEQIARQIVLRRALMAEARALGFEASDDAIVAAQQTKPYFQDGNGAFSIEEYRGLLQLLNLTPEQFDIEIRRDETLRVLLDAVIAGVEPPSATTELVWRRLREERDIRYLRVTTDNIPDPETPDEATLRAYYDEDPDRFRRPDRRVVQVLAILPERLMDVDAVTDEDVQRAYDSNIGAYVQEEERDLQLLIFPDEAAALEAAARINDGARILEIGAEIGQPPSQTNLEYRSRDDFASLNPQLAEEVFSPAVGGETLVGPIVLESGAAALVYVRDVREGFETPFEEVSEGLRIAIALSRARNELRDKPPVVADLIAQEVPLETIAEDGGYEIFELVIDSDGLDDTGAPADVPFVDGDFPRRVFAAPVGRADRTVFTLADEAGYYAIGVVEELPARTPPYDEIALTVATSWAAAERRRFMSERAEAIRGRLEAGEDIEELAIEYGLDVEESAGLTRYRGLSDTQSPLNDAVFAPAAAEAVGAVVIVEGAGGLARDVALIEAVREPTQESLEDIVAITRLELATEMQLYYVRDVQTALISAYSEQAVFESFERYQNIYGGR